LAEDEEYYKETLESIRLEAVENITKYQQETKKWRDRKVVRKDIQDGDLVLRKKGDHTNVGKLEPKWEGPYTAIQAGRSGSFYLKVLEGRTSTTRGMSTIYEDFTFECKDDPRKISGGIHVFRYTYFLFLSTFL